MYRDFEDLRDNCPFSLRADIAIDLLHDDPRHLAEVWPATIPAAACHKTASNGPKTTATKIDSHRSRDAFCILVGLSLPVGG